MQLLCKIESSVLAPHVPSILPRLEEGLDHDGTRLCAVELLGQLSPADLAPHDVPHVIEFLQLIVRDYDYGLEDQVNEMITRYGKPVWLTEFALWRSEDWCTDEVEREWLLDMVDFLENHPMVFRYAWFTGRRPDFPKINLLGEEGELTPLGEAYVNAPFNQDP